MVLQEPASFHKLAQLGKLPNWLYSLLLLISSFKIQFGAKFNTLT